MPTAPALNVTELFARGNTIEGQLKKAAPLPGGKSGSYQQFTTERPTFAGDDLLEELTEGGATVRATPITQQRGFLTNLLISFAPILLLIMGLLKSGDQPEWVYVFNGLEYKDANGAAAPDGVTAFRPQMAVHGRFGEPCPDCGSPVQRIVYADNETNYCARCQTGGRLLADRALSRLLREDWPKTPEEMEMLTRETK